MKIESKAIISASIVFYFIGYMVLDSALRSQPDSIGLKGLLLLINSFKWAVAGALIAIAHFQLKKKRILIAVILLPLCVLLTYGDVHKLIQYETYLSFAKASARGEIPLDPLVEKWRNNNLGHGEIRGIDLALRANVDVSVKNIEYMANRSMAEFPEHVLILQGIIRHKNTPDDLIRKIYEFRKEEYGFKNIEVSEITERIDAINLCRIGAEFRETRNTPKDILEEIINACERRRFLK